MRKQGIKKLKAEMEKGGGEGAGMLLKGLKPGLRDKLVYVTNKEVLQKFQIRFLNLSHFSPEFPFLS